MLEAVSGFQGNDCFSMLVFMVEIIFIGTGGGRFNLVRQARRTGGFRIHGKAASIHVDPGPGAALGCRMEGINPQKTDALIVTHAHIDHVCEAPVISEAMAGFSGFYGKHIPKGILIGSKNAIEGTPEYERAISKYHLSKLEKAIVPEPGREIEIAPGCVFCALPLNHDEKTGFGFIISMDGAKIGHISDTDFSGVDWALYSGCDMLVANVIKPFGKAIPDHLSCSQAVDILKAARPKKAVITHIGLELDKAAEKEAARLAKESGVETMAARDGLRLSI